MSSGEGQRGAGSGLCAVRLPWLFVGDGDAAQDWRQCHARGITRFLRLGGPPPPVNRMRPSPRDAEVGAVPAESVSFTVQDVMNLEINDDEEADLLSILPACNEFIVKSKPKIQSDSAIRENSTGKEDITDDEERLLMSSKCTTSSVLLERRQQMMEANNGVLVYCSAGISRSQSVVASFLMWSERLDLNQAMAELPHHASPNANFMKQLLLLERMGGGYVV